jgi:hypothetical protein
VGFEKDIASWTSVPGPWRTTTSSEKALVPSVSTCLRRYATESAKGNAASLKR